jgi:eukaryotic-like serine/threonine-protein kinase
MALTDRYDLAELLGEGSFGQVFRAFDRIRRRTVAIKVLHRQDDDARQRFHREAVVLHSQLANEHVVGLLDHEGLNDRDPYIVLEFCELRSLRSWVGAQRDWKDIAKALLHAAKGLAGVHAAGGLHRDIKPENMLLARAADLPGWRVKLADFGLAGFPHPVTGTMTLGAFGTQGYIAPELFGGAEFHPSADVYSLGIVGVELLVGRIDVGALQASGVPAALVAVVWAMVNGLPQARPTAKAVVDKLEAALTEVRAPVLSAPKPSVQYPPGAPTIRAIAEGPDRASGWGWAALFAGAAIALGTMNSKDGNGRFHGSDGKFRSGRWG